MKANLRRNLKFLSLLLEFSKSSHNHIVTKYQNHFRIAPKNKHPIHQSLFSRNSHESVKTVRVLLALKNHENKSSPESKTPIFSANEKITGLSTTLLEAISG